MQQHSTEISLETAGPGANDISNEVVRWVESTGIRHGLLTLYVRHTSASLMIQENYDPEVLTDMERFLARLVPKGDPLFRHTAEGPDDMPAHVRSALTNTSLSVPVLDGSPVLGRWQGIFLYEHRARPHRRSVALHLLGES
jgi:secondary thiamine-phosphate synthase enzyme